MGERSVGEPGRPWRNFPAPLRGLPALKSLIALLQTHHPRTVYHCRRVRHLALLLGRALGLDREERQVLGLAARLHDIGKLYLPVSLLDKPAELTLEEYRRVQQHAILGERLLAALVHHSVLLAAVRHHHEQFDGGGYPDRLQGTGIPLAARVLAIADCFDALTGLRPYRRPLSPAEALDQIAQQAGSAFDPALVDVFITVLRREGAVTTSDTDWPAGHAADPVGEGRRTAPRYRCSEESPARVIVSDGQQSRWARAWDISTGGIGLLLSFPFAPGTPLSLHLRPGTAHSAFDWNVDVVYAERLTDGNWRLGCAFDTPLTHEQVKTLL